MGCLCVVGNEEVLIINDDIFCCGLSRMYLGSISSSWQRITMPKTPPSSRASRSSTTPNSLPGRKSFFYPHTHVTIPSRYHSRYTGRQHLLNRNPLYFFTLPPTSADAKIYLLLGQQRIAKFNEQQRLQQQHHQHHLATAASTSSFSSTDARNLVQIMMVVFRLPRQGTDIVLSYNVPLQISDSSSSKKVAHEGDVSEAEGWFREVVGSFTVREWGLFGN